MKLYVCWGTFKNAPRPGGHPCGVAFDALKEAGHDPEIVRCYGWSVLPDFMNPTPGRREVKRLTGKTTVPVLVTDDGDVITESRAIAAWANENPAPAGSR